MLIALDYDMHIQSFMAWPPCSLDLAPCDFFLWGNLKDLIYQQTTQTITEQKQHVCTVCETIPSNMFKRMSGDFWLRLRRVVAANMDCLENIIVYIFTKVFIFS